MKIRHIFIYFLLFLSTYCDLIPNNRVITISDSTSDFNLVEGITYKVVHLKSGLNLDSNDDGVYVNYVPPYQYWTLRKTNGSQYNIVNAKSELNLDSNGQRI